MARALIDAFRQPAGQAHPIEEISLVPGTKGMYEIRVNGNLVYSKLATGKHIGDEEAVDLVRRAGRP